MSFVMKNRNRPTTDASTDASRIKVNGTLTSSSAAIRCPRQTPERADMIGGLKLPRAGGIGVNANEVEDLPIWLLLSPLTTRYLSKSVGSRHQRLRGLPTVAASRARLTLCCSLDAVRRKRVCLETEIPDEKKPGMHRSRGACIPGKAGVRCGRCVS